MDELNKIIAQTVDVSWQQDVLAALTLMDPEYLDELQHHPEWLPRQQQLFAAFSQPQNKVRFVLLGESPYPRAVSANGYAFWDNAVGELWSSNGLSKAVNRATSLRNFIKMLLHAEGQLSTPFAAESIKALSKQDKIQTLDQLFHRLLQQGFLLLNASLVWSADKPVRYHAKQWYPFVNDLLQKLVAKQEVHFLLFGKIAQQFSSLPKARCLIAEHPYVLSFIENPSVLDFFRPLSLLRA